VGAVQTWGVSLMSHTKAKVFPSGEKVGEPHRPTRAIKGVSAVTTSKPKIVRWQAWVHAWATSVWKRSQS